MKIQAVLSGNEAVARGAWEAGVHVAAAYPGTPSTEIMENCGRYPEITAQWSINEKVALETAGGSAIAGARTLTAMKHVGLNVAADPLFTLSYTGVNGGLVIVTADDPQMHSSQNEQDNRHYAIASKVPMLEPADSAEAYAFVKAAFGLSEEYDTPILFRMTTRVCHAQGVVELGQREEVPLKVYAKNFEKFVALPNNARKRHPVVEARLEKMAAFGRDCPFNRIEWGTKELGIVTSGVSYQYVKEVFPDVSILKYGLTYPLNLDLAREFAKEVKTLVVIEEGDPILENTLRAAGITVHQGKDKTGLLGELSVDRLRRAFGFPVKEGLKTPIAVPNRPPSLCAGCSHRGVFFGLKMEKATVMGDIGCYTLGALPPLSAIDTCICMGASISGSTGFSKARPDGAHKLACVIGDSTFLHSGITGLIDAVHNRARFVALILDNRVTAMTGHQNNPNTGRNLRGEETPHIDLEALVRACGVKHLDVVDSWNLDEVIGTLQKHWTYTEPSVIIVRHVCVEWAKVRETQYAVDTELCTGCKSCVAIGCPAIIFDAKARKSSIDPALCIGCSMCSQRCRFEAIYRVDDAAGHRARAQAELERRAEKKAQAQAKKGE